MTTRYQPGLRVSEYVLESLLGAGAFAEVWQARHHIWESDRVAIKLPVSPDYVRYLQREGVMVHGLRHPNIVRVIGLDPFADTPYLVMELVRGPSLKAVIEQHPGGMRVLDAVTVLRGVLEGVRAAHQAKVLHRDLKPGNVLLDLAGGAVAQVRVDQVKIADFGLGMGHADALQSIAQSASLNRESPLVGTLAYMAPELRDNLRAPDARSDLYSIGVILFEMLTGSRPHGAETPSSVRGDSPPALDLVFQRLYARYDRRYESAEAALADVNAKLSAAGVPPLPPRSTVAAGRGAYVGPGGNVGHGVPTLQGREGNVGHGVPTLQGERYRFAYTAMNAYGDVIGGEIDARTCEEAEERIRDELRMKPLHVQSREYDAWRAAQTLPPLPASAGPRCPACGQTGEAGDQFCTSCGTQIAARVRRCGSCGAYPAPDHRFCILCGEKLAEAEGTSATEGRRYGNTSGAEGRRHGDTSGAEARRYGDASGAEGRGDGAGEAPRGTEPW